MKRVSQSTESSSGRGKTVGLTSDLLFALKEILVQQFKKGRFLIFTIIHTFKNIYGSP